MSSLALCYDADERHYDLGVEGGQFVLDDSLRGPVRISVHTDRRVQLSELDAAAGETDQRGWWGDRFRDRPIGSRLWLLRNAKATEANAALGRGYMDECLRWMVEDGLADSIVTQAELDFDVLKILGGIIRPGEVAPRFFEAWEATRGP